MPGLLGLLADRMPSSILPALDLVDDLCFGGLALDASQDAVGDGLRGLRLTDG